MLKNNIKKIILIIFIFLFVYFFGGNENNYIVAFTKFLFQQGKYQKIISEGRKIDDQYLEYQGNIYKYDDGEFYELSQKMTQDIVNFKVLGGLYSKDSSNYFYNSTKIKNIDYDTFEILPYVFNKAINGTEILEYQYSKDKNYVYYGADILKGANPIGFEFIDAKKNLTKSGSNVFVQDKIVPNIDGSKFEYLEGTSFFKDDDTLIQFSSYLDIYGNKITDNRYFKEISGINVGKFNKIDSNQCGDGIVILDCRYGKKLN